MSIIFPNRTFEQTFPCGASTYPCDGYIAQTCNGYCPVDYDNFASNSPAPFFLEKYRELVDVLNNCRYQPDCYAYYTPVSVPINQHTTVVTPYYVNNYGYPKKIAERYYRVQY